LNGREPSRSIKLKHTKGVPRYMYNIYTRDTCHRTRIRILVTVQNSHMAGSLKIEKIEKMEEEEEQEHNIYYWY